MVAYLLVLLYALSIITLLAPGARWVSRFEQRWADLWMR